VSPHQQPRRQRKCTHVYGRRMLQLGATCVAHAQPCDGCMQGMRMHNSAKHACMQGRQRVSKHPTVSATARQLATWPERMHTATAGTWPLGNQRWLTDSDTLTL
jgi:hypothetical protein